MDETTAHIFGLHREATALCARLKEALRRERSLLVTFKVEEIPHVTLEKESLVLALARKRRELKDFLRLRYNLDKVSRFAEKLEGDLQIEWTTAETEWQKSWAETRDQVESNDHFLRHSLRNLTALADNLRRCLGEQSLYNAKGGRVDLAGEGKVVAKSF